jgi:hypothetical protein
VRRAGVAGAKGVKLLIVKAGTESEIDAAFASLVQLHPSALHVGNDQFFSSRPGSSWSSI